MAKKTLGKEAGIDIQIAGGMVVAGLASPNGLQTMQTVLQHAQDPANALGQIVFKMMLQVKQKLQERGVPIDNNVWLADKGVVDRVIFEVVGLLYGVLNYEQAADPNFVHAFKDSIVTAMEGHNASNGAPGMPEEDDESMEAMPDDEAAEGEQPMPQQGPGLLNPQQGMMQ